MLEAPVTAAARADLDAGPDATADAASSDPCALGPLATYCGAFECPALADARDVLRNPGVPYLKAIIQRPCTSPSGAARIAVTGQFAAWSQTYIYDATTEQLVGVHHINDLACGVVEPSDPGFDSTGFFGEVSPGCTPGGVALFIPEGCAIDAGTLEELNGSPDSGPPYECVLTP